MARFSGSAMYLQWIHPAGTALLHSEFRQFDWTPTLSLIDASAGADTFRNYLPGIGEGGDIQLSMVMPTGATGGTALISALALATQGTLVYSPEGTAVGKPKFTIPAFSKGPAFSHPYDGIVEMKIGFQQSAAYTSGVW
jgi:hypothetical protein